MTIVVVNFAPGAAVNDSLAQLHARPLFSLVGLNDAHADVYITDAVNGKRILVGAPVQAHAMEACPLEGLQRRLLGGKSQGRAWGRRLYGLRIDRLVCNKDRAQHTPFSIENTKRLCHRGSFFVCSHPIEDEVHDDDIRPLAGNRWVGVEAVQKFLLERKVAVDVAQGNTLQCRLDERRVALQIRECQQPDRFRLVACHGLAATQPPRIAVGKDGFAADFAGTFSREV